ncbi:MAG TPA: alpha/beta hydrolase [Polyangiaceae bacterium]|nr:alpha/beta hydrolase [Polyangiaceae bacterium]
MNLLHTALFGALTLGLVACGQEVEGPGVDGSNDVDALEGEPIPTLQWRPCGTARGRSVECTELEVPLNDAEPDLGTVPIAINRVPADPNVPRLGALFANPGGPGVSGKEFVLSVAEAGFFDAYAPGFDIIGFDPRGVADSGSVDCAPSAVALESDESPMTADAASPRGFVDALALFGAGCAESWGPLFDNVGSNRVVRDLERLRRALDEPVFNYLGISYGTRLGALYAHEFPDTTGAIVLDAPVPPLVDLVEQARGGFEQTLTLLEAFFVDCETAVLSCPPGPRQVFDDLMADAREIGRLRAVADVWFTYLARPDGQQQLAALLAEQAQNPDWLLMAAAAGNDNPVDAMVAMAEAEDEAVLDNATAITFTVNCIDANTEPPTIEEIEALRAEFGGRDELFANQALAAGICTGWPAVPDPVPLPTVTGTPPLLLIGGTRDLRTPLVEAEAMRDAIGNARLVVSEHYGHGGTLSPSDCRVQTVRNYLQRLELPAEGLRCPP